MGRGEYLKSSWEQTPVRVQMHAASIQRPRKTAAARKNTAFAGCRRGILV